MSLPAEKVAEMLAMPEEDRASLARQLIASLEDTVELDTETEWKSVISRRSLEIQTGKVTCRPVAQTVETIREKLRASRQPS